MNKDPPMRTTVALLSMLAVAFVGCEKREEKKAVDQGMNMKKTEMHDAAKKA
jgi:hypothetical protein